MASYWNSHVTAVVPGIRTSIKYVSGTGRLLLILYLVKSHVNGGIPGIPLAYDG